MSLKPSAKGVTALIVIAVVIFFGCAMAYMAAAGKMRTTANELAAKQKKVDEGKRIAQKLEDSKLKYLDAKSQVRFLESSVSNQAYVPTLLKQLEILGKSVNLNVIGVRPQPVQVVAETRTLSSGAKAANGDVEGASQQKAQTGQAGQATQAVKQPYDELKIDIEVEGRYMNALDFLYKLTSFPKIVAVNTVDVEPTTSSDDVVGSPVLKIKVNLTAFVFKSDAPVATPDSQAAAPASSQTSKNTLNGRRGTNEAG
ncbi:MAG: type 4a pilus biogenesis protein PilO [Armatimonadota bacterium]